MNEQNMNEQKQGKNRRRSGGLMELRRRRREERVRDFYAGEDGDFRYHGIYMVCENTDYRTLLGKMLAAAVLVLGFELLAGCVTGTGMDGRASLLVPYAGTLVATLLAISSLVRMRMSGPQLRSYQYKTTAERLPAAAFFGILLSAVGIIAWIHAIVSKSYTGSGIGAAALPLSYVTGLLGHGFLFSIRRKLKWHEERA